MTNYKVLPHNNAYRIYYRAGDTAPWQDLMELDPHAPIWRDYPSFEDAELAMKRYLFYSSQLAKAMRENRAVCFTAIPNRVLKDWTPQ